VGAVATPRLAGWLGHFSQQAELVPDGLGPNHGLLLYNEFPFFLFLFIIPVNHLKV
jgi:hypothetical protein